MTGQDAYAGILMRRGMVTRLDLEFANVKHAIKKTKGERQCQK